MLVWWSGFMLSPLKEWRVVRWYEKRLRYETNEIRKARMREGELEVAFLAQSLEADRATRMSRLMVHLAEPEQAKTAEWARKSAHRLEEEYLEALPYHMRPHAKATLLGWKSP